MTQYVCHMPYNISPSYFNNSAFIVVDQPETGLALFCLGLGIVGQQLLVLTLSLLRNDPRGSLLSVFIALVLWYWELQPVRSPPYLDQSESHLFQAVCVGHRRCS